MINVKSFFTVGILLLTFLISVHVKADNNVSYSLNLKIEALKAGRIGFGVPDSESKPNSLFLEKEANIFSAGPSKNGNESNDFSRTAERIQGNANGGGGGSFVYIDGRIFLSDSFYDDVGEDHYFSEFPNSLKTKISQVERLLKNLGIHAEAFWKDRVRSSQVIYTLVSPKEFEAVPCDKYLPRIVNVHGEHKQIACTLGNTTYLIAEEFKKASLLVQAMTIIHERLWSFNSSPHQQRYITRFIDSLYNIAERQDLQFFAGDRNKIDSEFMKNFDRLEMSARQFGMEVGILRPSFSKEDNVKLTGLLRDYIYEKGGGLYFENTKFGENVFIGIGSIIYAGIYRSSVILESVVLDSEIYGVNINSSFVSRSTIIGMTIKSSIIDRSKVDSINKVWVSELGNSYNLNFGLNLQSSVNHSEVVNSTLNLLILNGDLKKPIHINSSYFVNLCSLGTIEAGSEIFDSKFDFNCLSRRPTKQSQMHFGKDIVLQSVKYTQERVVTSDENDQLNIGENTKLIDLDILHSVPISHFLSNKSENSFAADLVLSKRKCKINNEFNIKSSLEFSERCKLRD